MLNRRYIVTGIAAAAGTLAAGRMTAGATSFPDLLAMTFAGLERKSGGSLGVALFDTRTGARLDYRAERPFPMCSTVKLLIAGAVLARIDRGADRLDRRIRVADADLLSHAPVTKSRVGGDGMSLEELCAAAITVSDNTAANLLLDTIGGPSGLNAFARSIGDDVTRLDRSEPDLSEALPDDPRDTTTPSMMVADMQALVLGSALAPTSRARLVAWLVGNRTGDARLRAGLPKHWRVGDKTGTGGFGTTNDVGIIWPPQRAPFLVAAYLTGSPAPPEERDATIAAVGRAVAATLTD